VAKSMEELQVKRPVDRVAVDALKKRMLDEVRAYRLGSSVKPLTSRRSSWLCACMSARTGSPASSTVTLIVLRSIPCGDTWRRSAAGFVSR
jgi:hypothetical protein